MNKSVVYYSSTFFEVEITAGSLSYPVHDDNNSLMTENVNTL